MHVPDFGFNSLIVIIDSNRRVRVEIDPPALQAEIFVICECFIPIGLNWNAELQPLIPLLVSAMALWISAAVKWRIILMIQITSARLGQQSSGRRHENEHA